MARFDGHIWHLAQASTPCLRSISISQSLHRMSELVNVVVAFAVIIFIVRWATSGAIYLSLSLSLSLSVCITQQANRLALGSNSAERTAADTLGFRPKNVTPEMASCPSFWCKSEC